MVDAETGERIYVGGVVSTSGAPPETVTTACGRDRARVDRRDRVRGCERVRRP
jgi:hypothetical protein